MTNEAKFHHIGYAVNDIEKAKREFTESGFDVSDTVIEPVQKVYVSYARKDGNPTIELLQPLDDESPIVKILTKNGPTPYHICYSVPDIKTAMEELRRRKYLPLGKPVPGHGLDDALMVFMFKKEIGLVQLVQL